MPLGGGSCIPLFRINKSVLGSGLFVFARRDTEMLFEHSRKIHDIRIAGSICRFGDAQLLCGEQLCRFVQSEFVEILLRRYADTLFKDRAEIAAFEIEQLGYLRDCYSVVIMCLDTGLCLLCIIKNSVGRSFVAFAKI